MFKMALNFILDNKNNNLEHVPNIMGNRSSKINHTSFISSFRHLHRLCIKKIFKEKKLQYMVDCNYISITIDNMAKVRKIGSLLKIPHLAENAGHLFSLLLSSLVSSQLSLSHFQCSLVLSNFKKLSDSLLIWGKASNFPDQIPHKENSFATFLS